MYPNTGTDSLERDENAHNSDLDSHAARWIRRHAAGGVSVITTVHGTQFRGATVNAWMTASIDPFQLLVSIEEDSQMEEWIRSSGVFACNLLPWSEQFLADQFAGFAPLASGTFQRIPHFVGATGSPLLRGCIAWVDCKVILEIPTGDHTCFVGAAVGVGSGTGRAEDPLVYFANRYHRLT